MIPLKNFHLVLIVTAIIQEIYCENLEKAKKDGFITKIPLKMNEGYLNDSKSDEFQNETITHILQSMVKIDVKQKALERHQEESKKKNNNITLNMLGTEGYDESNISEIFFGLSNKTDEIKDVQLNETIIDCENVTAVNYTLENKIKYEIFPCNHSLLEKAKQLTDVPLLGAVDTVAVAAGVCLVSAVLGYFSCISYRRYLQRKYGNSQILAHEDVYDTTDLRYFEI